MAENKKNNKLKSAEKSSEKKKIKIKKEYLWAGIGVAVILIAVIAFFIIKSGDSKPAGSADSAATDANVSGQATNSDSLTDSSGNVVVTPGSVPPSQTPDRAQSQPEDDTEYKYSDAELYEKDGKTYGVTDNGVEVELSGENLEALMQEYMLVQGTGSEREKELLDQIQMILDNAEELPNE